MIDPDPQERRSEDLRVALDRTHDKIRTLQLVSARLRARMQATEEALREEQSSGRLESWRRPDTLEAGGRNGGQCADVSARYEPLYAPLIQVIVRENRKRARLAEQQLDRVCFEPECGIAAAPVIPRVWEVDKVLLDELLESSRRNIVCSRICESSLSQKIHTRRLYEKYSELKQAWIAGLERRISGEKTARKRAIQRERDRFILLNTREADAISSAKLTSSGRVTYRSASGLSGTGTLQLSTVQSLNEVDAVLDEIELCRGTPQGVERWRLTSADIPDQDPLYKPVTASVRIDDPLADLYACRARNPWTVAEKMVFLEQFLSEEKQFKKIASALPYKSVYDCVRFYFQNKLRMNLKPLLKEARMKKKATATTARKVLTLARRGFSMDAVRKYVVGVESKDVMDTCL
ncbi:Nuclear receptor corepressor 2 [Porphyridium purpureum]|uniref:Nuclear receptor corepressor 2 n=1 Tax=Porphyridium purpureum TaxID=35688 RepID=A0A5J4Z6I7_PORPP|nr:Nuclear receptor corepressor 2 [Porphyridium purpureum]|eukprot:POR4581..scf295_1